MTLGFSQVINKKPNFFVEKIWTGLPHDIEPGYYDFRDEYFDKFHNYWDGAWTETTETDFPPKLHTIRIDEHDRWKAGSDIHFVINNRTPKRFQFAPVIKCVSVQTIRISWHGMIVTIYVDGRSLSHDTLNKLAINDGFDSLQGFFAYFNKDFTGKIIHWTDLKY